MYQAYLCFLCFRCRVSLMSLHQSWKTSKKSSHSSQKSAHLDESWGVPGHLLGRSAVLQQRHVMVRYDVTSRNMFLSTFSPFSPVKFSGGDCWSRSPLSRGTPSVLQPPQDQAMELSTAEQMDVTTSSEASAPLPIRQPAGVNLGQMKQQAYPVVARRPEHLRMNL